MVAKNSIKPYVENGFYHLYNRGVAKMPIYLDVQDYKVFLGYLKEYLSPLVEPTPEERRFITNSYICKNYHQKIELLAFCLLPNHFHFLLKQNESRTIEHFMRSLLVRYSVYFNRRYRRVGHLFQDVYKGILVDREEYLLWLSRYIHRNPLSLLREGESLESYSFSSYQAYLGKAKIPWLSPGSPGQFLTGFRHHRDYKDFVEGTEGDRSDLKPYILED